MKVSSKSRIDQWEQQEEEPNGAFEDFAAYLALPREDRTYRGAWRMRNGIAVDDFGQTPPGRWFELAAKWQWKDRARAFDRESDRKVYAKIEAKRAASALSQFEQGGMYRERASSAVRMMSPVEQTIGERDGMPVVLVAVKMTPAEAARLAQVGLEMEQMGMGSPTSRVELVGNADAPLMVTVDNAKGELMKRIAEAKKRREQAAEAAQDLPDAGSSPGQDSTTRLLGTVR